MLYYYCLSSGERDDYENIILTCQTKFSNEDFVKYYNAAVEKIKSDKEVKYVAELDLIEYIADYMCKEYGFAKMPQPEIEISNQYLNTNEKIIPIPLDKVKESKKRYVVDEYKRVDNKYTRKEVKCFLADKYCDNKYKNCSMCLSEMDEDTFKHR